MTAGGNPAWPAVGRADLVRVFSIPDAKLRAGALSAIASRRELAEQSFAPTALDATPSLEASPASPPAPTPATEEAPPTEYWAAVRFELCEPLPDVVESLDAPLDLPAIGDVGAKFDPLRRDAELAALLRQVARASQKTRSLDMRVVVDRVSRCAKVEPLPYRTRRAWGDQLIVLRDRSERLTPFAADQHRVVKQLRDVFAFEGVIASSVSSTNQILAHAETARHSARESNPGASVLALTDLGSLSTSDRDRLTAAWLDLGIRLQENGQPAFALVPTVESRIPPELRRVWTIIPWAEHGAPRVDHGSVSLDRLLIMASPAVRLELGLLRAIRKLDPAYRHDPGWEALFWQHPAMADGYAKGVMFAPESQRDYLARFGSLPVELRCAIIATLQAWHGANYPLLHATSVMSLPAGALSGLDQALVDRAKRTVVSFSRQLRTTNAPSAGAKVAAADLVARTMDSDISDRELTAALHRIREIVPTNAASAEAPRWSDERYCETEGPETLVAIWQPNDREMKLAPVASTAVHVASGIDGPPLAMLRTRTGRVLCSERVDRPPPDPFWESGKAPTWASAWGVDEYGRWAEFAIGAATQRMRWIEPGTFRMGSPEDEEGRDSDEGPVHEVTITQGYWLFDTPCCQDLWNAVGLAANPRRFAGKRRPVESVPWDEAVAFLDRLSEALPGLDLRLPREAEWEYACRAGTTTARYGVLNAVAWHSGNSDGTTHDVGEKQANAWGLYDTLGNVWEWCLDSQRKYTKDAAIDPDGGRGAGRVIRGGCWLLQARSVRAAYRFWLRPVARYDDLGFRALSSGASPAPGGRVRIGSLRRAEPDARGSAPEAPKKTRILVRELVTEELPSRNAFQLQSDVETCVFERIPKPSWARDFGRDRYGLWCTLEIGDVVQRMRWIPPGRFLMGSPPEEEGRDDDEGPMHPVVLTAGYWLFDTPCTQALWSEVMNGDNPSRFRDPLRPVENVTYDMVTTFLDAINRTVGGLGLKLPTEAQWEYACRAGTTTATYAGDLKIRGERDAPVLDTIAWYGGNSGHEFDLEEGHDSSDWREKQYKHTKAGTRRVATKDANGWGLYDMLGNVWEWCDDFQSEYTDSVVVDLFGERGAGRVIRGGSWAHHARLVRAASRRWYSPVARNDSLGFRALSSGEASSGKAGGDASG